MNDFETLYRELRSDLDALASPLLDFARQQLQKRGSFLPFSASLNSRGEVALQGASPGKDVASSAEILPILHEGLRTIAVQGDVSAVAVCEWVKITPEGEPQTDAVKVLVEHARGLAIGFYLPCRKRFLGGWRYGEMLALPVPAEIRAWPTDGAS